MINRRMCFIRISLMLLKAVAFMKYGDYPVSLYTELVDITIPIYTVRTGRPEIPIELRYHASSLRYDDIAWKPVYAEAGIC